MTRGCGCGMVSRLPRGFQGEPLSTSTRGARVYPSCEGTKSPDRDFGMGFLEIFQTNFYCPGYVIYGKLRTVYDCHPLGFHNITAGKRVPEYCVPGIREYPAPNYPARNEWYSCPGRFLAERVTLASSRIFCVRGNISTRMLHISPLVRRTLNPGSVFLFLCIDKKRVVLVPVHTRITIVEIGTCSLLA